MGGFFEVFLNEHAMNNFFIKLGNTLCVFILYRLNKNPSDFDAYKEQVLDLDTLRLLLRR